MERVEDAVRRRGVEFVELSHAIHAEPKLAFAEHHSCAKAQALLAERGVEITAATGGVDTAFRTDTGNVTQVLPGIHPVIGVDAGGAKVAAQQRRRSGAVQ